MVDLPLENGVTRLGSITELAGEGAAALVIQSPNFLGLIEDVEAAAELARKAGAATVVSCNPVSLSVLKPPGELGADIATGEGQPLGVPMSFGGPGFGFLSCPMDRVRRLPGRVVGQTEDREGRPAYVLTFQTREQHIRRERATSNICTNHALMALRAVIHLTALGRRGFAKLGELNVALAHETRRAPRRARRLRTRLRGPLLQRVRPRMPRAGERRERGSRCGRHRGRIRPSPASIPSFRRGSCSV